MNGHTPHRIPRRVVGKYVLIHLLGLIPLTLILLLIRYFFHFSTTLLIVILAAWCVKDAILFPFVWKSYDTEAGSRYDSLVGQRAIVLESLKPEGWVKIHGQRWRARLEAEVEPGYTGAEVVVKDRDGLTLIVTPAITDLVSDHLPERQPQRPLR